MSFPSKFRLLLLALLPWAAVGCAIHIPGHCQSMARAKERRDTLLDGTTAGRKGLPFLWQKRRARGREFTVLVPPSSRAGASGVHTERPAVIICEELNTISAGILELAERLGHAGYAVYLPVLFGHERENPASPGVQLRAFSFVFGHPDWQANAEVEHRLIVAQVAELCRQIAREHHGLPIGVIGLCLTGSFPLELLGEAPKLPIAAPVLSQPSIPVWPRDERARASLGMSEGKIERLAARVKREKLSVLGFRFELDEISPPERFAHLQAALGKRFVDRTLPAARYLHDDCPRNAHAVLTDGFKKWEPGSVEPQGHLAWRRLVWFLDLRLKGREHPEPEFDSRSVRSRPSPPPRHPSGIAHL